MVKSPSGRQMGMRIRTGEAFVQNTIRFPAELYELLREATKTSGRSLNNEVCARVLESFGPAAMLASTSENPPLLERMADDLQTIRETVEAFCRGRI